MVYIPDSEKARIEHVRRPGLPWRSSPLTECGKPADGQPCITRDDFLAKVRREGQQRSALTTCMTCWDTAMRHKAWDEDPISAIQREAEAHRRWGVKRDDGGFLAELYAIAALIELHRSEFDELIEDQRHIVRLPVQGGQQ